MSAIILGILGPIVAAGLLALDLLLAVRAPVRARRLGRAFLRGLHRKAESVVFGATAAPVATKSKERAAAALAQKLVSTRMGIWGLLASTSFLFFWIDGWVRPSYTLGFLWHLGGSWLLGVLFGSFVVIGSWACAAAWKMSRAQMFASRTGLTRIWLAQAGQPASKLGEALGEIFWSAKRIEFLDFTGYELLAKGSSDAGGVLGTLLARFPEKEARVLLFNPCARDIDPGRKHTTVLQSQLGAMEMSREAFESKLRATLDRIDALNRGRPRPIEVRLYSEKPSFRVLVAGDTSFLGAIDARDAAGEFPFYEARRLNDGPSLHAAARSHFLRVWGDSSPVTLEAASLVEPAGQEERSSETALA